MATATAIYELDTIGVNGAYEATGRVHFYCSPGHANTHAIAEGYRSSANFSQPQPSDDAIEGTVCEWCGEKIQA